MAHTPGPWTSEYEDSAIQAGRQTVARVYWHHPRGEAENKANAHLLAASPDLLAALKELVAAGQFAVDSVDDVAIMMRLGRATDAAHAAIAKAEGA